MTSRANAKKRARDFEYKEAARLGGHVHAGQDGDIEYPGPDYRPIRGECKRYTGLQGYGKLGDHIRQAISNGKKAGMPWSLHLSGGKSFRGGESYTLIPTKQYRELIEQAQLGSIHEPRVEVRPQRKPTFEEVRDALERIVQDLERDEAQELGADLPLRANERG